MDSDTNEFQVTGIANHSDRNEKNVEVTVTFYKVDSKTNETIVWTKLQKFSTDDSGFYVIKIPEKLGRDPAFRLGVKLESPGYFTREIAPFPLFELDINELISKSRDPDYNWSQSYSAIKQTRLAKGTVLKGAVRLPGGKPAAGARIFLKANPYEYHWKFPDQNYYDWVFETTADESGQFQACLLYTSPSPRDRG